MPVRYANPRWKQLALGVLVLLWVVQVVVLLFSQLHHWHQMGSILFGGQTEEDVRIRKLAELTEDDTYDFVRFCQEHISPNQNILVLNAACDIRKHVVFRYYLYPYSSFYCASAPFPDGVSLDDFVADKSIDYVIVNGKVDSYPRFFSIMQATRLDYDAQRFLLVIDKPTE